MNSEYQTPPPIQTLMNHISITEIFALCKGGNFNIHI